jgi:ABC-type polysaccharide/polyol phosphate export permease
VPRLITVLIISNTSLVILIIGLLIFSKYKNKFPELLS